MQKFDGNKIAMTAINAFVSAACGMLGNYAMHKILNAADKATEKAPKKQKHKIGFDLTNTEEEIR